MRPFATRLIPFVSSILLASTVLACNPGSADARRPHVEPVASMPVPHGDVSVTIEHLDGRAFSSAWWGGSFYVAGEQGEAYQLRIHNRDSARVEVVVTVDGRDVISGEIGDYRRQRGYVIDPGGQVIIDGFRQSLSHVAQFRFSGIADSYSARQGTPQHVGVIGVAVFKERRVQPKVARPIAPIHAPTESWNRQSAPHDSASFDDAAPSREAPTSSSFGGVSGSGAAPSAKGYSEGRARSSSADEAIGAPRGSGAGSYAPAPAPRNEIGTEYGETQYSSVREVSFRRAHRSRPDTVLTVYYDSLRALWARGIPIPEPMTPYMSDAPAPEPFPSVSRRFAPPPPRR